MWYVGQLGPLPVAVVLSSLLFGWAHSYQGWTGVIQSGAAGLVLAVIYVFTGALWIPIALHIAGDAYSGLLGWLAFDEAGQRPGPSEAGVEVAPRGADRA